MSKIILIAGTAGKNDEWCQPNSEFVKSLEEFGERFVYPFFQWNTMLDGIDKNNDVWFSAARLLGKYVNCHDDAGDPIVIAHSHGGQVALAAAADGCGMSKLITVATPVRKEMEFIYREAQMYIEEWVHIHSDFSDVWQVLGGIFDGRFGIYRRMKYADRNVKLPGIGHSGALTADIIKEYL